MKSEISNEARNELLALYQNATDNITYLKNRAFLVLASWSAVFIYLNDDKNREHLNNSFLVLGLMIAFLLLWGLYHSIYEALKKHRERVTKIKRKLSREFQGCYGNKGPGYGGGDWIFYVGGIFYIIFLFILMLDRMDFFNGLLRIFAPSR